MTVYATFAYFRKMLHLNFWMWHIHASLQTSWVHWCVAYFDLGAQEPHGFQLFQALLPALLMESSTSGVAQLEQMRQEALRYWHEVQFFWSTSEFLWIQIEAVGNHKKTKKTAISQDLPSQEFTSLQRKDETKHWISQAAPHGVAGVAISESPFPWQIHCEDMGVARMHGRLRLCRYKITMIRLWQIVMITFGWRLNSLGTQLNISQDVLGLCGRLESRFPLHAVASISLKELTSCHKFLAKKHVNYAEQQLYRSHMRMSSSNASIICRQNMIQHCAGVQHHTQKSQRYPHRHWIRMIMLPRQHGRRLLVPRCVRWMSSKSTEKRRPWNA